MRAMARRQGSRSVGLHDFSARKVKVGRLGDRIPLLLLHVLLCHL